ncbi:DUF4060 family protein [Atlantibacter hermannii]|uniref:DUF4060 family protein n=2 Tax=Atlantibacter hermannii TaxID=565 RepID=UPI000EB997B1|nr:DUF4060 family protein [Atlantibacter hermannii]HCC77884.1 DUF4060 domain-containing protein [Shigella sp.]
MRLINRGSKQSPVARQACAAALQEHYERFGDYGITGKSVDYMIRVDGTKLRVEIRNCQHSYIATPMDKPRRLRALASPVMSLRGKP